jgi:hypothetical protein
MVQIEISGPEHSHKGYLMVAIAKILRDMGAEVVVQGEETHLAQKTKAEFDSILGKIAGLKIAVTEMKTRP